MSDIINKWRDLSIDPFDIKFNNFKLKEIISYPYAGNDVVECLGIYNNKEINVFIKIERSKMACFSTELEHLKILYNNYYNKVPRIIDSCTYNNKEILVLEKIDGNRLSNILNDENKEKYLKAYGNELALIHSIPIDKFENAKQRIINSIPTESDYKFDDFIKPYIVYLKENSPFINHDCFIHGDFHYANILWNNERISGVLDWEYSGIGFKEQDIAWSIILRPSQAFMDNINDINLFLEGYKEKGTYNEDLLKWCLINGYCHFYLMNITNIEYTTKIKELLDLIQKKK